MRKVSNFLTFSLPHFLTFSLSHFSSGFPSGFEKTFEQRPEFARAPESLAMPLDAGAERRGGVLDRLDDTVGRRGYHIETGRESLDRLMMPAIDLAGLGVAPALAHQPGEHRVFLEPDLMREGVRLVCRHPQMMIERARHL